MYFTLGHFYENEENPLTAFRTDLAGHIKSDMAMGVMSKNDIAEVITFLANVIYGYFYADLLAYDIDEDYQDENYGIFLNRLGYDVSIRLPYWYRKYNYIKKLLTDNDFTLLQTSKMTSSSSENTDTASGTLQKTATTPTGVSADGSTDKFEITIDADSDTVTDEVKTTGFADKYTNAQQKFANAGQAKSEREGEILREGSIEELINVLEKLPSSFADEVNRQLQKHFIFDYDGEMEGVYDEQ